MATIDAATGFQLRMDHLGRIPELNSEWTMLDTASSSNSFSGKLINGGPYGTEYSISVAGEIDYRADTGLLTGVIDSMTLNATSTSIYGQKGPQLTISGADTAVKNASKLPLNLFLHGDDVITGSVYADRIVGRGGNDSLDGRAGPDVLRGNTGRDTLLGNRGNDHLFGNEGSDALTGDSGNDFLTGGAGRDVLTGGSEADRFIFSAGSSGNVTRTADVITDWRPNVDAVDMPMRGKASNYLELGTSATSIAWAAEVAENRADGGERFVFLYNTRIDTGYLLSDLNGDGRFETGIVLQDAGAAGSMSYSDII